MGPGGTFRLDAICEVGTKFFIALRDSTVIQHCFALVAGSRKTELTALRWVAVDFAGVPAYV